MNVRYMCGVCKGIHETEMLAEQCCNIKEKLAELCVPLCRMKGGICVAVAIRDMFKVKQKCNNICKNVTKKDILQYINSENLE